MKIKHDSLLQFYATPAPMTDIHAFADQLGDLPEDLPGLVQMLQGLLVHIFWAERYGLKLSEERQGEVNLRPVAKRFARLFELDPAPLTIPRPLERRLVSNCRDFTLMLVALLRWQGKPARARCGFGTYFTPGRNEDHWVAQVWDGERWRWADAQLDELQRQVLKIEFDPLDMPTGAFLTGGAAWQLCRVGRADPDTFGIFEWKGWDFIRGDLFRDLLALDRFEILPWDFWTALEKPLAESPQEVWEALDRLAQIEVYSQADLEALQATLVNYHLYPPEEWAD
jgi:hypothetical protein